MYAASNKAKAGDMKKYGRVPPPNPTLPAEFPMFVRADQPIFSLRKRFGRELGYSTVKEDSDLTLSEVWCHDEEKNTSEGECTNQEIGVKYEYDLGGEHLFFQHQIVDLIRARPSQQHAGKSTLPVKPTSPFLQ